MSHELEMSESNKEVIMETESTKVDELPSIASESSIKTHIETGVTRLPRKEWRKIKKKQRKKIVRTEAAKLREQAQENKEEETSVTCGDIKAEERKRNAERILWEVRERHIEQMNSEKRQKQEEEERRKKIIQENWEKTVKNIKTPKPVKTNSIPVENSNNQLTLSNSSPPIIQEEISTKSDYGTEKDQINCPFYLKTGACRYDDLCGRHHPYPDKSVTILIKNMYEGMPIQLADEDNDDNLEFDEVEAERHYSEFFQDVHSEFLQYGTIIQFKVIYHDFIYLFIYL
ncbi:hypothetical protein Glove_280g19 [Diversispora epigaea]|uniref:C3H1-type domain-containing protein n=1 Tax=Diversispora epigaea TaxID=1348612 RepID=A0A397IA45_9GLOM|nr:hypothetical protein Glove_280g19 [Diversispora epigaea]